MRHESFLAIKALDVLPRAADLGSAVEDAIHVFDNGYLYNLKAPFVFVTEGPVTPTVFQQVHQIGWPTEPTYIARLHHATVFGERDIATSDGRFLEEFWSQAGLMRPHPSVRLDNQGRRVISAPAGEVEYLPGRVAALSWSRACAFHHSHWLIQTLPYLGFFESCGLRPDRILVDSAIKRYQREMLAAVGYDSDKLLLRDPGQTIVAEELLVAYVDGNMKPDMQMFDRLLAAYPAPETVPERIFVSRMDSRDIRRLQNEQELIDALERDGFRTVLPSKLSVAEEVNLFRGAKIVCGALGAGLYNTVFTSERAHMLALSDPNYMMIWPRQIAAMRGQQSGFAFGVNFFSDDPFHVGSHSNWLIDPESVRAIIAEIT